ncbi:MAG TPA: toxin TcdB middle/N-terminal domain-containing protein, partial [Chitinophagaceae bacterium]|nr:toxin TcdB middle/N-terminal domain-containing protein [Chitinophagaceae bacterium]
MFHCFSPQELPVNPYLTKSLELFYDDELDYTGSGRKESGFSFLVMVRQSGHIWDAAQNFYTTKSLPETEFSYQQHEWDTAVHYVTEDQAVQAPAGLQDKRYLWIDLFNEGIAGILTEQGGSWYYKSNLGGAAFSAALPLKDLPSFRGLAAGMVTVEDMGGNASNSLVHRQTEPKGFFAMDTEGNWQPMTVFPSYPVLNWSDPNMKSIDLTGDGKPDLVITEDTAIRWYESLGEEGFSVSRQVSKAIDEEKGPAIVFADSLQTIFLADMNGDGLTDIVRIRNGEICYWPNCGFGVFGRKTGMDHAPVFDSPEMFNPSHIRLADIDGSGTMDVVYLGHNDFRVWMNNSGNAWSTEPHIISAFPPVHNLSDVAVLDFLGNGTACIVYSTSLGSRPLWYIDLMKGKKPHLLISYKNNCGKEFFIDYKSSTHFYLEDKKEGRPWITRLPFPVHCIYRTRSEDYIRKTVFTSSYRYSHGYYDQEEREFRGFGRVEQLDTDDFAHFKLNNAKNVVEETLHQAPVKTISWFHTGAYLRHKKILHQYEEEYFKNNSFAEYSLPDIIMPAGLTSEELREAYRACKGSLLRTEVYANDNLPESIYPFSATESNLEIRLVQPKEENNHAVFQLLPAESVGYSYDRAPDDPRIAHSFILEKDSLGFPIQTASVVYKRIQRPLGANAIPDKVWQEQNKLHIVISEAKYTNDIIEDDVYRLRSGYESKTYELGGLDIAGGSFFSLSQLRSSVTIAAEILFEDDFTAGIQKRLTAHSRGYFLKDDLSGPLPLAQLSKLAIGYKSYSLVFTKNLVTKYYGTKVTDQMLSDARYIHSEGDEHWWAQGGEAIF